MAFKYNPRRIALSWRGIIIGGFAKGTFVTVDRDEDAATKNVGNDGRATVILNPNEGCSITFVLQQGSIANEILSALVPSARANSLPVGDANLKDLNGTTLIHADTAWLKRVAKVAYGDGDENREWMLDCEAATIFAGGSVLT